MTDARKLKEAIEEVEVARRIMEKRLNALLAVFQEITEDMEKVITDAQREVLVRERDEMISREEL